MSQEPPDGPDRPGPRDDELQRAVADRLRAEPSPELPVDVAARLQAAVRGEADTRPRRSSSADRHAARLEEMRSRRRRRLFPLLAAAAVAVGVVAVGSTVLGGGDDSASTTSTQDSAAGGSAGDTTPSPSAEPTPTEPQGTTAPTASPEATTDGGDSGGSRTPQASSLVASGDAPAALSSRPDDPTCADGRLDVASTAAVRFTGARGWLVSYPGDDGATVFEVYACDGDAGPAESLGEVPLP